MASKFNQRRYYEDPTALGVKSGMAAGEQWGNLVAGIGKAIEGAKQDQLANQLMNTGDTAPRAALVNPGVSPLTGDPNAIGPNVATTGSAPFSGGTSGINEAMKVAQLKKQLVDTDYEKALKESTIAAKIRSGRGVGRGSAGINPGQGNASAWISQSASSDDTSYGGRGGVRGGGKPAPYAPGSIDPETNPEADDFAKVRADFDNQYGKGRFDQFNANLPTLKPDEAGNYSITDPKSGAAIATVPSSDTNYWMQRSNAARVAAGQSPIGPLPPGTNPQSGKESGTQENPVLVTSNLQLRSLPFGAWIVGPDGRKAQKQTKTK